MSRLKEINSNYKNISFSLFERNLEKILYEIIEKVPESTLNKLFNSTNTIGAGWQIFIQNGSNGFTIKKLLLWYNRQYLGYDKEILKVFLSELYKGNIDKVVKFTVTLRKKIRYITYNFFQKKLPIFSKNYFIEKTAIELEYAGAFFHYGLLVIVLVVTMITFLNEESKNFLRIFKDKVNLAILTGIEGETELQMDYPFEAIAEELLQLTSKDEKKLAITKNPEKCSLEFRIKDNSIFHERYKREGYHNLPCDFDLEKDRKTHSLFRISKGKTNNSVIFKMKRASGHRTLGHVFSFKPNALIHPNKLFDANMLAIKNFLCFCFMAMMENVNFDSVVISDFHVLDNFIKNYSGERNKADRIAVLLLVAKHPELEEEIINTYFKHKVQRENFLKDLKKLKNLLNKNNESFLAKFVQDVEDSYVW